MATMSKISEISRRFSNQLVLERTLGEDMQHLRIYALRGMKLGNCYLISNAHFLPNGNLHDILISFDGDERAKMMVKIDNKIVFKLDIKDKLKGASELYLNDGEYLRDELVVKFKWNLFYRTKIFRFYTKSSPHKKVVGDNSYNSDDNDEPSSNEEEFEPEWYACRLHVYATG